MGDLICNVLVNLVEVPAILPYLLDGAIIDGSQK